jgi:hypothetical protein
VCGCNSDNTLINKELRWAPSMHLKVWVHILGSEASYTLFAVVSPLKTVDSTESTVFVWRMWFHQWPKCARCACIVGLLWGGVGVLGWTMHHIFIDQGADWEREVIRYRLGLQVCFIKGGGHSSSCPAWVPQSSLWQRVKVASHDIFTTFVS